MHTWRDWGLINRWSQVDSRSSQFCSHSPDSNYFRLSLLSSSSLPPLLILWRTVGRYFQLLSSIYRSNSTILISPSSGKRCSFLGKADGWPSDSKLGIIPPSTSSGALLLSLSLIWSKRVHLELNSLGSNLSSTSFWLLHEYMSSLGLSVPILYNGSSNSTYFVMLLRGLKLMISCKTESSIWSTGGFQKSASIYLLPPPQWVLQSLA